MVTTTASTRQEGEDYDTWAKRILKLPRTRLPGEDDTDWRERCHLYRNRTVTGMAEQRQKEAEANREQVARAKHISSLINRGGD